MCRYLLLLAVTSTIGAVSALEPSVGFAQGPDTVWTHTYGGASSEYGYSVLQASDGGYVIVGTTFSFGAGSYDVYLIKTDANGEGQWAQTYGGAGTDYGRSVQQTFDGGYVIAGYTNSSGAGDYDVLLIKTDSAGVQNWAYTYGGKADDRGRFVQQTLPDSGYIIAGYTETVGAGGRDAFLVKTDSAGSLSWSEPYGGTDWDEAWCVRQTFPDSGYIVVGSTASLGAGLDDVYLIKTDANGDTMWTRTYGGTSGDYGYQVEQTLADTGYIITGNTYSFGSGDSDMFLVKTGASGDSLWMRTFGGISTEYGYSLQQTSPEAGYIISGSTRSFGEGSFDVYIVKTDGIGWPIWSRTYGGSAHDEGFCVRQTAPDSGYVIAGSTRSFGAGVYDVYVLKTEPVLAGIPEGGPLHTILMVSNAEPNPFRHQTLVTYQLLEPCRVDIAVYNVLGRKVAGIVSAQQRSGIHTARWDGKTDSGGQASSGMYYLRIEAAGRADSRKLLLLR
jgi:hypothetical protein